MNHKILALVVAIVLSGTAYAQTGTPGATDPNAPVPTQPAPDYAAHHDYGWIGLFGLLGLFGVRNPNRTRTITPTNGGPVQ